MYYYFVNKNTGKFTTIEYERETKKSYIGSDFYGKRIISKDAYKLMKMSETDYLEYKTVFDEFILGEIRKEFTTESLYKKIKEFETEYNGEAFLIAICSSYALIVLLNNGYKKEFAFRENIVCGWMRLPYNTNIKIIEHAMSVANELSKKFNLNKIIEKRSSYVGESNGKIFFNLSSLNNKVKLKTSNQLEFSNGTSINLTLRDTTFSNIESDRCFGAININDLSEVGISYSNLLSNYMLNEYNENNQDLSILSIIQSASSNSYECGMKVYDTYYLFNKPPVNLIFNIFEPAKLLREFLSKKELIEIKIIDTIIYFTKEALLNHIIVSDKMAIIDGLDVDLDNNPPPGAREIFSNYKYALERATSGATKEIKTQIRKQLTRAEYAAWDLKNSVY